MLEIVIRIIKDVLATLYQSFGIAIVLAALFMFLYMLAKDNGWKNSLKRWLTSLKNDAVFRRVFVLAIYTSMILLRTLLNRNVWGHPLENVIGIWGLHNANGELTTEVIENLALFIPFSALLLWVFQERIISKSAKLFSVLWKSVTITFSFSLTIELLQLFFRIGTFQLSDLFYNTLGGFVGGMIYGIGYKICLRVRKGKE